MFGLQFGELQLAKAERLQRQGFHQAQFLFFQHKEELEHCRRVLEQFRPMDEKLVNSGDTKWVAGFQV